MSVFLRVLLPSFAKSPVFFFRHFPASTATMSTEHNRLATVTTEVMDKQPGVL